MKNPFVFGKTVSNHHFTNREEEMARMIANFKNGINTLMVSPRRWGKTSLVEKTLQTLQEKPEFSKHYFFVHLDMFSIYNEKDFYEKLATALLQSTSPKWEEWLETAKKFFIKIIPSFSIGPDPYNSFSLSFQYNDIEKNPDEILNLSEKIAQEKKAKVIVCIDEFQNIAEFNNYTAFEKKLRSVWQSQKHTSYCLYGSKRHMLLEIFTHSSKPFYKFGEVLSLKKISTEHWLEFILQQFKKTNKKISEKQALWIIEKMDNHSYYVQQLSHYVWNHTQKEVKSEQLEIALKELLDTNTLFYIKIIEGLSKTQIQLLKAIVKGETQYTAQKTMQTYSLGTPNNVRKNSKSLSQQDIIDTTEKPYTFLDPVFKIWFQYKFT